MHFTLQSVFIYVCVLHYILGPVWSETTGDDQILLGKKLWVFLKTTATFSFKLIGSDYHSFYG